jgi:hypothetical protein
MGKTQVNDDLQAEIEHDFNRVVLTPDGTIGRVIGYSEDARDCYTIVQHMGGRICHHSCVGMYYSLWRLKGQGYVLAHNGEEWDDYYRLDNMLALNGAPKQDEFKVEIDHENVDAYQFHSTPEEALNEG